VSDLRYTADLDLAASAVSVLGSVEDSLELVVRDLRWRVSRLPEVFEGEAALAFLERHDRWEASYVVMRTSLASMRTTLRTARRNYRYAADANLSMWRSVR
jgi:uncharacterized protein YukE